MISVKLLKEQPNARKYVNDNEEMVKQTRQSRKAPFKIDDMVAIKIDRVEKTKKRKKQKKNWFERNKPV